MGQLISVVILANILASGTFQDVGPEEESAHPPQKSPLFQLAETLGRAAGNAEYCAFDERRVEDFIVNAMARLAAESEDQVLLAGSRIEFNAHAAYGRSEGPSDSCEAFELTFRRLSRRIESDVGWRVDPPAVTLPTR